MLSRSAGLKRHSRVLGFHRDVQDTQAKPCPQLRQRGRCRDYARECHIRKQVAQEKEEELKKKATAMYALQMDLLADLDATAASEDPEVAKMRQLLMGGEPGSDAAPPSRATVIDRLVQELKAEPAYVHWNLEAAVVERMVEQRIRRCPFSHRPDALRAIKRARTVSEAEEAHLQQCERQEQAGVVSDTHPAASRAPRTAVAAAAAEAAFTAERARVFANFTPLQRCVVSLMWQQTIRLPRHVVSRSVRAEVEREVEAEMTAAAGDGAEVDEEALEAYLDSPAFEERVRAAESAEVEHVVFRPALGVLDLAALPQVVSYVSHHQRRHQLIAETTAAFFGSTTTSVLSSGKGGHAVTLTEKELDLSPPTRAVELVEAVEWGLHVYNTTRRLQPWRAGPTAGGAAPADPAQGQGRGAYAKLSHRVGRVVLRSLSLRNAQVTLADGLVASLHKSNLGSHLLALDLSDNRLHSLRFLFALRAHFAERLLRLSLKNNLITRKPEYQEQVRRSLPRLTSLDGEPIRRPPLCFPKSHGASCTMTTLVTPSASPQAATSPLLTPREYDLVMDTLARLFYIWETRRVPHTQRERAAFLREARHTAGAMNDGAHTTKSGAAEGAVQLPVEEDLHEDNFPHRYLHPSATFTFTAGPGVVLFDASTMKLDREVEGDDTFTGVRLSAHDMKDARVFDVAVRSSSRNLLAGRTALQRVGRGAENCYLAYQYSIYPERVEVDHGLAGAVVSVTKLPAVSETGSGGAAESKGFGTGAKQGRGLATGSHLYMVTLHGVMTWRLPSMRGEQCFRAAYDRTMTFTEKLLTSQNYAWERRRSPMLVLCTDQLLLRPITAPADSGSVPRPPVPPTCGELGGSAIPLFSPATPARAARLVVQFGLEVCQDGEALVRAVMERTTSDAAEEAALDALVLGPAPAPTSGGHEPHDAAARAMAARVDAAVGPVLCAHIAKEWAEQRRQERRAVRGGGGARTPSTTTTTTTTRAAGTDTVFHIFSLLDRPGPESGPATESSPSHTTATHRQDTSGAQNAVKAWGGSRLHRVPLSLIDAVTRAVNECLTMEVFPIGRQSGAASA